MQATKSTFMEGKGASKKVAFPVSSVRGRGPSKKHTCFLEGVAWNFSWLAPLAPHLRYDWTTKAPHDGNDWKKYLLVPRAHPSRTLLYAYFKRSGSKGAFSFPGARWDRFTLYGGAFARSCSGCRIKVHLNGYLKESGEIPP